MRVVGTSSPHEMDSHFQGKAEDLSELSSTLESTTDESLRLIDDCASSRLVCRVEKSSDSLQANKTIDMSSVDLHCATVSSEEAPETKLGHSGSKFDELETHVTLSPARNRLDRLPSDALLEILDYATASDEMKALITLSHVCGRFRSIVLDNCKLWARFRLKSSWHSEMILAVVERSGSLPLMAVIDLVGDQITDEDKIILDLSGRLQDLWFLDFNAASAKRLQDYLQSSNFPILRTLRMEQESDGYSTLPGHFTGFCPMPMLRTLFSNFVPHASLGRTLDQFTLQTHWIEDVINFRHLLNFLSTAHHLRTLTVKFSGNVAHREEAHNLVPISLPHLDFLHIQGNNPIDPKATFIFMEKVNLVSVGHLCVSGSALTFLTGLPDFLQGKEVHELALDLHDMYERRRIDFGLINEHIEVLSIAGDLGASLSPCDPGSFEGHGLHLLRIAECSKLTLESIFSIRAFLMDVGRNETRLEFKNCTNVRDGSYALDDVHSAFAVE